MIKKLRIKFILVNMAFAASILAIIMGFVFFVRSKGYEMETERAMIQALNRRQSSEPLADIVKPGRHRGNSSQIPLTPPLTPTCVLIMEDDGITIADIKEYGLSMTDDTAKELTALVNSLPKDQGPLKEYAIRYLRAETPDGKRIVFGDLRYELTGLRTFFINCVFIFLIADLLFFLLSLFLSKWALKPVEQAWQQQNQFIADASHELKTPLTVILANLQILSSHETSTIGEERRWLNNTREEAAHMRHLVEELLFLARHDAGITAAERSVLSSVDFSDVVLTCVLLFESVAFESKVSLDQDIEPGILVTGNEGQLKQVVTILLDNACKYARGHGNVGILLKKSGHFARLVIHNPGEPIPEEDQKHIFERFYRADKSRVRKEGGYGLGLAIAKTILEEHHGKISVTSSETEGTAFIVMLPILHNN